MTLIEFLDSHFVGIAILIVLVVLAWPERRK